MLKLLSYRLAVNEAAPGASGLSKRKPDVGVAVKVLEFSTKETKPFTESNWSVKPEGTVRLVMAAGSLGTEISIRNASSVPVYEMLYAYWYIPPAMLVTVGFTVITAA